MFETIFSSVRAINQVHPELRFQQIMTIAAQKAGWKDNDLFYCPDATIKQGLDMWLGELTT